jgi:translocation and assembly module TamB
MGTASSPPNIMESPGAGRPRRRLARIIAGVLLGLVATLALVLITAVAALHNLGLPWLKQRIVSRVEAATGLQLDYQTAQIAVLSGLRLEGLVVRTPSPFQSIAPELLRVGTLEVQWSPGELLSGPTRVERVTVRDVAIALVADEAGPTSLTGLMAPKDPEPPPVQAPLGASQQMAALLASAPPFGKVEVSGVSLSYVRVRNGEVIERWSLRGLAATVEAKHRTMDGRSLRTQARPVRRFHWS